MDALDFRIFRETRIFGFYGGLRKLEAHKPSAIARRLGVTAKTVNDRLASMREAGVFGGYGIAPNLRAVGHSMSILYHWLDPSEDPRANRTFANVEGLGGGMLYFGGGFAVEVTWRDEAELAGRMRAIASALGQDAVARFDYPYPPHDAKLTPLDLRILLALRRAPTERPPPEAVASVAEAVGVSARTVKRRLERMAAQGSFDVECCIVTSRLPSAFVYSFVVTAEPGRVDKALARAGGLLEPASMLQIRNGDAQLLVMAQLPRPGDADAKRKEILAMEGVARVDLFAQYGGHSFNAQCAEDILARAAGEVPRVSIPVSGPSRVGR